LKNKLPDYLKKQDSDIEKHPLLVELLEDKKEEEERRSNPLKDFLLPERNIYESKIQEMLKESELSTFNTVTKKAESLNLIQNSDDFEKYWLTKRRNEDVDQIKRKRKAAHVKRLKKKQRIY
jgi:hypothetical protein